MRQVRRRIESGQAVATDLVKMSRAYLDEAQSRLGRLEKDTRPLRKEAIDQLDRWEVESRPLRRQAARRAIGLSYDALDRLDSRAGTGRRRRSRAPWAALAGLLAGAGIGYMIADRRSRAVLQGGLVKIQGEAKQRVPAFVDRAGGTLDDLRSRWTGSGNGLDEAALKGEVESAVRRERAAAGLEVGVEGRTIYLRGSIGDRAALDGAIERSRSVEGVAAVINLATVGSARKA
ncbi:MAG: BON domain-containing protein [Candidatus Dormibacteraceae bacterium]